MIINLDKLEEKLKNVAAIQATAGITKGCLRVERDAKILVPVDTGLLRNSITHNVEGSIGEVGTSIEYAPNVELGLGQRAQPYLAPALAMNRENIRQDITDDILSQLRGIKND